jgi:hypothetical protein
MLASDIPIWIRFIEKYPDFFDSVDYDIHVGHGVTTPPETEPKMAKMMKQLTQKRIDVVGYKEDQIWLIETKLYAGVGAIGQILSYHTLYKEQFNPSKKIVLAIITDRAQADISRLCTTHHINLFEV